MKTITSILLLLLNLLIGQIAFAVPAENTDTKVTKANGNIFELEFKEALLGDVIRVLAEETGNNIIATKEATEKEISIYLKDVTLKEAIESICRISGLWYRQSSDNDTFRIMTIEEYSKDLIVHQDDEIRVFELLNPNVQIIAQTIQDIYGQRVILSLGLGPAQEQIFSTATGGGFGGGGFNSGGGGRGGIGGGGRGGIGGGGRGGIGGGGRGGIGGGIGGGALGGGGRGGGGLINLSRNQLENEAAQFEDDELSVDQIATLSQQSTSNAVDPNLLSEISSRQSPIWVTANNEHNLVIVRTGDRKALEEIDKLVSKLDKPVPQVLLEMKVLDVLIDDDFRSLFDVDLNVGQSDVANATATGNEPTNSFDIGNFAAEGGTFVYRFFSDRLQATLEFLERNNRVNTLSTPVILASNNRPAELFVGEEAVITTGVDTLITEAVLGGVARTILQPQAEIREVGNRIFITPRINDDKTITLELQQETSSVNIDGGSIIVSDGVGNVQEVAIDTINTSNILGTVVAQDGYTMAVGGLIRKTKLKNTSKVPVLGDLPALGWLFRREQQEDTQSELILLITPHVLDRVSRAEKISRERVINNSRYSEWNTERVPPDFIEYKQLPPGPIEDDLDIYQRKPSNEPEAESKWEKLDSNDTENNSIETDIDISSNDAIELIRAAASSNKPQTAVNISVEKDIPAPLFYDRKLIAYPEFSWEYKGLYVTRIKISNISKSSVDIIPQELRGDWKSVSFDQENLQPEGETFGYLVSIQNFRTSIANAPVARGIKRVQVQ